MGKKRTDGLSVLYGLLVLVILLQAVAIGLVIRFEDGRQKRDGALLERTASMLNDIFPRIRNDLSAVSETASVISKDVAGLRDSVSKMDEHVGEVGNGVANASRQVDDLDRKVTGFVLDRSGLIWGHSLNPYVLVTLLLLTLSSAPLLGWVLTRKNRSPVPATKNVASLTQMLAARTVGPAHSRNPVSDQNEDPFLGVRPELRKIMEETERRLDQARRDSGLARLKLRPEISHPPGNSHMLN